MLTLHRIQGERGRAGHGLGKLRTGPDLYTTLLCLLPILQTTHREDFLPLHSAALILDTHTVRVVYKCWERWKRSTMQYTYSRVRILEMGLLIEAEEATHYYLEGGLDRAGTAYTPLWCREECTGVHSSTRAVCRPVTQHKHWDNHPLH